MISKENITTLISAESARKYAANAYNETTEASIAHAINSAVNTGELMTHYVGNIPVNLIKKLKDKGYTCDKVKDANGENTCYTWIISWEV